MSRTRIIHRTKGFDLWANNYVTCIATIINGILQGGDQIVSYNTINLRQMKPEEKRFFQLVALARECSGRNLELINNKILKLKEEYPHLNNL